MDWQLVASYFTIKSRDIFYSVVGLDKIPYAAYDHTFFTWKHPVLQTFTTESLKGSSQHKVGGEWFEIKLGKISRMLVKYEVLPIPNVIFVC